MTLHQLQQDMKSVKIEELKGFSDLVNEHLEQMLDVKKVFHVYSPMPGVDGTIQRKVFHETQLLTLKFHKANEVKTYRVSLRIVTGSAVDLYL